MDGSRMNDLLTDVQEMERLLTEVRGAECYPASFFDAIFHLNYDLFRKLQALEEVQVQALREQMEAHQRLIDSINPARTIMPELREEKIVEETLPSPDENESGEVIPEELIVREDPVIPSREGKIPLNEVIEKKILTDFRKAISLNDWFRFKRDLFKGNEALMNAAIHAIDGAATYDEAFSYLEERFPWDADDPTASDFLKLLEKRFR